MSQSIHYNGPYLTQDEILRKLWSTSRYTQTVTTTATIHVRPDTKRQARSYRLGYRIGKRLASVYNLFVR